MVFLWRVASFSAIFLTQAVMALKPPILPQHSWRRWSSPGRVIELPTRTDVIPSFPQSPLWPPQPVRLNQQQGKRRRAETTKANTKHIVSNAYDFRELVLDEGVSPADIDVQLTAAGDSSTSFEFTAEQHDVLRLIKRRVEEGSKPGRRAPDDNARLALALEGGSMRGAVSAGMAAAIAVLGLQDCFDAVYGSSAGSCTGAYFVSGQLLQSRDIYLDILTKAKSSFVSKYRILRALTASALDWSFEKLAGVETNFTQSVSPGMNLSYVLDHVMCPENGLRGLDVTQLMEKNEHQSLRIVSSYVKDGSLLSRCFGVEEFHNSTTKDGRNGIYACLEASMTVPGAAGPPVGITIQNQTHEYFDAFCFEPLPYRSAVEEGATHVMTLCSRPACHKPVTTPGVYEKAIAPLYFANQGDPDTAHFFACGGQQYVYAEDLLTLKDGANNYAGHPEGVIVPPPRMVYGLRNRHKDNAVPDARQRSRKWKRAHLWPLKVPAGTPELNTLEQDRGAVLRAMHIAFATAYDQLAPLTTNTRVPGSQNESHRTGRQVAELLFPENLETDTTHDSRQLLTW